MQERQVPTRPRECLLFGLHENVAAARDTAVHPRAAHLLESTSEEVNRMTRIVEDLLTLARADEGGFVLERARLPLFPLAHEVTARFATAAATKGILLTAETGDDDIAVRGDHERLGHLLSNLVDNAIKYTPEGGTVQVLATDQESEVHLIVRDSGPGIPAEALPKIFDRF